MKNKDDDLISIRYVVGDNNKKETVLVKLDKKNKKIYDGAKKEITLEKLKSLDKERVEAVSQLIFETNHKWWKANQEGMYGEERVLMEIINRLKMEEEKLLEILNGPDECYIIERCILCQKLKELIENSQFSEARMPKINREDLFVK